MEGKTDGIYHSWYSALHQAMLTRYKNDPTECLQASEVRFRACEHAKQYLKSFVDTMTIEESVTHTRPRTSWTSWTSTKSTCVCLETAWLQVVEETLSFTCEIDILFLSRCNLVEQSVKWGGVCSITEYFQRKIGQVLGPPLLFFRSERVWT